MAGVRHVVVLGGSGFVGRHLVPRLLQRGNRVTVLTRRLDARVRAAVPREASLREGDVYDGAFLRDCLADAHAVVNLTGILNERGDDGRGFERVYVGLVDALIEAMRAAGVRRLLQMSALRAGEGESRYLQARGRAERRVERSGLDWTLFRSSVIAGPGDGLFCRFAALLRFTPVLPVARAEALFQPVWVGDVAEAFARALHDAATVHRRYDLAGPDVMSLREIIQRTAQAQGHRRWVIALPPRLGRLQAEVGEWLPGKPISRDNWRSLQLDSLSMDNGLPKLGIVPTDVRARVAECLHPPTHD